MPNLPTGAPSINDAASSSSASSSLPHDVSSDSSSISSRLQAMLDKIKTDYITRDHITSEELDEFFMSLDKLRDEANEGSSKWDSPEWLSFLSKLSIAIVESIKAKSYYLSILFVFIDLMEGNVKGADNINKILVPIASAAAEAGIIEIIERIEQASAPSEFPQVLSTFDCSIEPFRQAILHAQESVVRHLISYREYSSFDIHSCLFELYAKNHNPEHNMRERPDLTNEDIPSATKGNRKRVNKMLTCLDLSVKDIDSAANQRFKECSQKSAELSAIFIQKYHQWKQLSERVAQLPSESPESNAVELFQANISKFDETLAYATSIAAPIVSQPNYKTTKLLIHEVIEKLHQFEQSVKDIDEAIKKLKAQEKQLQDANFSWLMARIKTMETQIVNLKTENKELRAQLSAESNKSLPSRTEYSVFGAASSSKSSSSGNMDGRTSTKRDTREDQEDHTGRQSKLLRTLS